MTGTISPSSPSETAIPRLTSFDARVLSPSSQAFSAGCSRRASIVARATNASAVTPSRAPRRLHAAHVDLDPGRARGRGVERALHVLADLAAHARQPSPLGRPGRPARGRDRPAAARLAGSGRYGLSMCSGGSATPRRRRAVAVRPAPARPACARARRARCPATGRGRCRARRRSAGRPGSSAGRRRRAARCGGRRRRGLGPEPAAPRRGSRRRRSAAAGAAARPSRPARRQPHHPRRVSIRASTTPTSTVSSTSTRISATTPLDRRRDLGVDLVGRDLADRLLGRRPGRRPPRARRRPCPRRPTPPSGASSRRPGRGDVSTRGAHGTPP